jgi:hypothetical protein
MTETKLEPAVGRLLVTPEVYVWEITAVHLDGGLDMRDPMNPKCELNDIPFLPHEGEWIARDLPTVQAWARLMGVKIR